MDIYDNKLVEQILKKRDQGKDYQEDVMVFFRMHKEQIKNYIVVRLSKFPGTLEFEEMYARAPEVIYNAFKTYDINKKASFKTYYNNYLFWYFYKSKEKSSTTKIHRYYERVRHMNNGIDPSPREVKEYIDNNTNYHVSLKRIVNYFRDSQKGYNATEYNHLINDKKKKKDKELDISEEDASFKLQECKKVLTPTEYKSYKLRYVDGFKIKEVAIKLGLKPNTVSKALKMAKNRMMAEDIKEMIKK